MREIAVFGGSSHPALAAEICAHLGVPLRPVRLRRFANDCLEVQLQDNCRERDVFLIQPLGPPVQENLVELLLMLDAARGASAARVTAVIPHYAYARSDKKDMPRVSIGGRLVADLLVTAGVSRVLAMTLHALRELAHHFSGRDLSNTVVVSPDLGNAKQAAALARMLDLPVAAGAKVRHSDSHVTISSIIGEVAGRDVIVLDDEIARGTTIMELLSVLQDRGARSVRIACTHGLFCDGALERISARPEVEEIVCTNTVPVPASTVSVGTEPAGTVPGSKRVVPAAGGPAAPDEDVVTAAKAKLHVISVAPALAEAIRRIHEGESVSALFDDPS